MGEEDAGVGEGAASVGEEAAGVGEEGARVGEGAATDQGRIWRHAQRDGREACEPRGTSERMGSNGVGWGARHSGVLRHEQAHIAGGIEAAWE